MCWYVSGMCALTQFWTASSGVEPYLLLPSFANSSSTSFLHALSERKISLAPMSSDSLVTGVPEAASTAIVSRALSSCDFVPPYSLCRGKPALWYAQVLSPGIPKAAASGPLPINESVVSPGQPLLVSWTPSLTVFPRRSLVYPCSNAVGDSVGKFSLKSCWE